MSAVFKPVDARLAPMRDTDIDRVLPIENDVYAFPWTRGNFRDSLAAGYSCWLNLEGSILVGYAVVMLVIDEAHLLNLSIARALQGRGHGRRLLAQLMATARSHGAKTMLLEVRPTNLAGLNLYARAGFAQVGTRSGYYPAPGGREDALVLSSRL